MSNTLTKLHIRNFRSLQDISIETNPLNVLFGPNGSGKSNFLDSLWFVRDCAIRGVDIASSERSHGIGVLWDGADEGANISIEIETDLAIYKVDFGYSSGRIEPFVGEYLVSKERNLELINRKIGSDQSYFYHNKMGQAISVELREPEKLALTRYLDFDDSSASAVEVDRMLRYIRLYLARDADLYGLKKRGSESNYHTWLWDRAQNLWSVLRNLHDRRNFDNRYDTIIAFMQDAFPSFKDLLIEQTGPTSVYGNFVETNRRRPIQASGVSDGHLQLLTHLTALFSEGQDRESILIFDEPEISLHPYALAVFAKAVQVAAKDWEKQIFIATHSPVLISQFDPVNILATEIGDDGQTNIQRVSEMETIKDLLEQYATGSLYMAEMIAPQSKQSMVEPSL